MYQVNTYQIFNNRGYVEPPNPQTFQCLKMNPTTDLKDSQIGQRITLSKRAQIRKAKRRGKKLFKHFH